MRLTRGDYDPPMSRGRKLVEGAFKKLVVFVVERGSPGDGLGGLWLLFGGSAALVLGVPAGLRWRAGTLKPREIRA